MAFVLSPRSLCKLGRSATAFRSEGLLEQACDARMRATAEASANENILLDIAFFRTVGPKTNVISNGNSSFHEWLPGGTQNVMVTVLPSASVPALTTVQPSVRTMIQFPALVCSVICEVVNPITVPVSVLFPAGGGVAQLTRSATLAKIQIKCFVFIG